MQRIADIASNLATVAAALPMSFKTLYFRGKVRVFDDWQLFAEVHWIRVVEWPVSARTSLHLATFWAQLRVGLMRHDDENKYRGDSK